MMKRPIAIAASIALLLGCKNSNINNPDDEAFVRLLVPHHHVGIKLIDEAMLNAHDVRLRRLVFDMGNYHHSDLDRLNDFSEKWVMRPFPVFPGFINEREFESLSASRGLTHDVFWLELMIRHHLGAIEISRQQIQTGSEDFLVDLAESVISVQTHEIAKMNKLLKDLRSDQHIESIR